MLEPINTIQNKDEARSERQARNGVSHLIDWTMFTSVTKLAGRFNPIFTSARTPDPRTLQ
jgi:hypothetical protein